MLTGLPPFYSKNKNEIYYKIQNCNPTFYNFHSLNAIDLISRLLHKDPEKRLGSRYGIEEIKGHPFFDVIDWDKMANREVVPPYTPMLDNKTDLKHFDHDILNIPIESPPI
jgi:serine/threonine protein kinase